MNSCLTSSQKYSVTNIHLALSLNRSYWPEQSEPLLFDSGSYGDAISLLNGGFSIATPPPWTINTELDVISKINKYYALLQNVCDSFNEMFNNKKSLRFYRILLGPTLYWMLNVFYDRYWRIHAIHEQCPNIKFPVTNYNEAFLNTSDFVTNAKENVHYNAKIINYT